MAQEGCNDDAIVARMKLCANKGDKLHDLQLLRDLEIIYVRTVAELGPLPVGGLPAATKRKPNLPSCEAAKAFPIDSDDNQESEMSMKSMVVATSMAFAACAPVQEEKPLHKLNKNPKHGYIITMDIVDASGPYEVSRSSLQYDISNQQCLPPIRNFAGVQTEPKSASIPFSLTKVADGRYVGTIYLDAIYEEDFYGRGICQWELAGIFIAADMQFNSRHFYPELALWYTPEMMISEQVETFYFWKDGRGRSDPADPTIWEAQGPKVFRAELEAEVFSVVFSSRAAVQ